MAAQDMENREEHPEGNTEQEGNSRRGMLALLGLGLLGTRALAGCGPQGGSGTGAESLERTSEALATAIGASIFFDTIADMQNYSVGALNPPTIAICAAHSIAGDGGGGLFCWHPGDTTSADAGTVFAAATGVTPSNGRWRRIYEGPLNVRWFGARGNGTVNDTTAIQYAIDASLGGPPTGGTTQVRNARKPVYLPAGTYRTLEPIQVVSAQGLVLFGDSAQASILLADAANMSCVIDLNGVAFCTVRDLGIGTTSTGDVKWAVLLRFSPSSAYPLTPANPLDSAMPSTVSYRSTTMNRLISIVVANCRFKDAGFQIGAPGTSATAAGNNLQEDHTEVISCAVYGGWTPGETTFWKCGFRFGTGTPGNNLNHRGSAISATQCVKGVWVSATNTTLDSGGFSQNEVDFYVQPGAHNSFRGFRSEGGQRFLYSPHQTEVPYQVSVSDCYFQLPSTAPSGSMAEHWIHWEASGALLLQGIRAHSGAGITYTPKIYAAASTSGSRGIDVVVEGLAVENATRASAFDVPAALAARTSVQVRTFAQTASWGGVVVASHGGAVRSGAGAPNSAVYGSVGDMYLDTAGGSGSTLWIKETGAGTNTGWVAK